uniref:Uncharacterized protein n=1 Tax=Fagus sylvatica TaxID=28930 RepID=A0A2N9IGE0_FAGSY
MGIATAEKSWTIGIVGCAEDRENWQRVIGEPIVSGLALDESGLWDSDFSTAAKQEPALLSY